MGDAVTVLPFFLALLNQDMNQAGIETSQNLK